MDDIAAIKVLPLLLKSNQTVNITVKGHSMYPTLREGDTITITLCEQYVIGDILVFRYKNDDLLVHRLLKKTSSFFSKGDNAFRMEDFREEDIVGKVILINGLQVKPWPTWKLDLSYEINRTFLYNRYNILKTKQTDIFRLYDQLVLNNPCSNIKFRFKPDLINNSQMLSNIISRSLIDTNANLHDDLYGQFLSVLSFQCTFNQIFAHLITVFPMPKDELYNIIETLIANAFLNNAIEIY